MANVGRIFAFLIAFVAILHENLVESLWGECNGWENGSTSCQLTFQEKVTQKEITLNQLYPKNLTREKIVTLSINNLTMTYFPGSFKSHLPNIETVIVTNTSLRELDGKNLSENFPNLKSLTVTHCNLTIIDASLVDENTKLESVDLSNNNIVWIEPIVLQKLGTSIKFENNCYANGKLDQAIDQMVYWRLLDEKEKFYAVIQHNITNLQDAIGNSLCASVDIRNADPVTTIFAKIFASTPAAILLSFLGLNIAYIVALFVLCSKLRAKRDSVEERHSVKSLMLETLPPPLDLPDPNYDEIPVPSPRKNTADDIYACSWEAVGEGGPNPVYATVDKIRKARMAE